VSRNLALAFLIGIRFRMGKQGKPRKGGGYSPKREASVDSRTKLVGSLSVTYPRYNGEMDAVVYVNFSWRCISRDGLDFGVLANSGCF
jgi:hypothetical protein